MKFFTLIAVASLGVYLTACEPAGNEAEKDEKETVIIKEKEVVKETPAEENPPKDEKDGLDVSISSDEEGKVGVKVDGSVKDDN